MWSWLVSIHVPRSLLNLRLRVGTLSRVTLANNAFIRWGWGYLCWVCWLTILWRTRVPTRRRISWSRRMPQSSIGWRRIQSCSPGILGCLPVRLLKVIRARIKLSGGHHIVRSSLSCWSDLTSRFGYTLSGIVVSLAVASMHHGWNQQYYADSQKYRPNDSR